MCSNYRGISLLCIGLKILEAILLARFDDLYDSYARDNQAGFKKGRGCRDQVFALRQIIEQRSEYNRPTVMVFIDFKAAFDSVKRDAIWKILEDHGMPDKLLRILRNMIHSPTATCEETTTYQRRSTWKQESARVASCHPSCSTSSLIGS